MRLKKTEEDKLAMLRANSKENYFNNRIKDIAKFFANPDKQDKWENKVVHNIELVVNDKKGLALLNKEKWNGLREDIINFVQANDKCIGLRNKINKLGNELVMVGVPKEVVMGKINKIGNQLVIA